MYEGIAIKLVVELLKIVVPKVVPKLIRKMKNKRIAFIDDSNRRENYLGFYKVYLPMRHTTFSNETERAGTIEALKGLKYEVLGARKDSSLIIRSFGLPLPAGLVIGYSMHANGNNKLLYETSDGCYKNASDNYKIVEFKPEEIDNSEDCKEIIDLCFYIQANRRDTGSAAFREYVEESDLNPYIVLLVKEVNYSIEINLEKTAESLVKTMMEYHKMLSNKHSNGIRVHLFFNGFFGLALLLGNQMFQTVPVQLYDYSGKEQTYQESFELHGEMFN